MQYISRYQSPLGTILLSADGLGLTGLWFEGQKYAETYLEPEYGEVTLPVFSDTKRWLELYFSGQEPDVSIPLHMTGTPFQKAVWERLLDIPYGQTVTYGQLARELAAKKGLPRMSAQAVGGAVGRNRISILIPCHRVVGSGGNLTGYAGGLARKTALLRLEGIDTDRFFSPGNPIPEKKQASKAESG